ncbi:MAG: hypothetical protein G8345_22165, partial [Magnetococcales bacterium]|nr:hypothetical protein [Magnetococcales bacterium]NGZ29581.1 hypothetical protein [Magnetococcales bacterium]
MNVLEEPVSPTAVRLETSATCQLQCPLCYTEAMGRSVIGKGVLSLENFCLFIDRNPRIRRIELANAGEALLNDRLPEMLAYAYQHGVTTRLNQGVNLNHASEAVLEALVKYQTEVLRVSIDGISQEVYEKYRVGGNLGKVLKNIRAINAWKKIYRSKKPRLIWQFIVFGHNEHQLEGARLIAKMLDMEFQVRLNRESSFSKIKNDSSLREL